MQSFERDRLTWLAYLMLAYLAYVQATLGPLMPFLRDELRLNYAVAGLHFSAAAVGGIIAGSIADRVVRRWGRRVAFWGGAIGMTTGVLLLALGRHQVVTIASALFTSFFTTLLLITIQATLSDRHGEQRTIAITESNIGASLCAVLAPLLIGTMQRTDLGWRGALFLVAAVLGVLVLGFRRQPIPDSAPTGQPATNGQVLPLPFWAYWAVIVLEVPIEWSMALWGADFLEKAVGLSRIDASTLIFVFYLAVAAGRIVGSRLVRTIRSTRLLLASMLTALIGFGLFWLSPVAPLNVAGLFICGLGFANMYPLMLALTLGTAPEQVNVASARISLGIGFCILLVPQALGLLADQTGVRIAYSIVGVLLILDIALVVLANRLAARRERDPEQG